MDRAGSAILYTVSQPNLTDKRLRTAAAVFVLLAVNIYICRELFRTEYLNQLGSIEAAFIAIARWASAHWRELDWFPLWYNGIPYQNSYPPLLHLTVAAVSRLAGWPAALAYHFTVACFYCAGPVAVFALCLHISKSRVYSFAAGLMYSLLSPSAFLMTQIRQDMGSVWKPRRLHILLVYGEGPHVAGLALLPLAVLLFDIALNKRRPLWSVLAAAMCAATVLTNWLAAFALAAACLALLLSRSLTRTGLLHVFAMGALAYCFAAPWIPPSTIRTIQFNAKTIEGDYTHVYQTLPLYGAGIIAGLILLHWVMRRLRAAQVVQVAAVFTFIMGAVALSNAWWGMVVVPQPHRYHAEMEMGIAILLPFVLRPLLERTPQRVQAAIASVLLVAAIPLAKQDRRYARVLLSPVDMRNTVEYRMPRWFEQNMNGRRVMATGSVSFWMNAFTDTPQLGGGFDQGAPNFLNRVAGYVLYSSDGTDGQDTEISELWLKAFGIHAIGMGGPQSREYYKPWRKPDKFAGRYEELWREGGDVVYRVPQRTASLAHVMALERLAGRTPLNGIDVDPLRGYVAALDDPFYPPADFRWLNAHRAEISAQLAPGQVISVQITYDAGWRVSRGRAFADKIGLLAIDPECTGSCSVELLYDGGRERKIAGTLPWLGVIASMVWGVVWRRRSGGDTYPSV
jgi:hypothetical protein